MRAQDLVRVTLAAIEANNLNQAALMLSEELVVTGFMPQSLGKREFVELQRALTTAFPNWNFNDGEYQERGGKVTVAVQITGTHSGPLKLPIMNAISLPSGKRITLPKEMMIFTARNNKIVLIDLASQRGGVVPSLLEQLGISLPPQLKQ